MAQGQQTSRRTCTQIDLSNVFYTCLLFTVGASVGCVRQARCRSRTILRLGLRPNWINQPLSSTKRPCTQKVIYGKECRRSPVAKACICEPRARLQNVRMSLGVHTSHRNHMADERRMRCGCDERGAVSGSTCTGERGQWHGR